MESQLLKNELHKYLGYTTDCPTNASFNQRRAQIKSEAFQYLFQKFTASYNKNSKLFKGYRLLACDGSDINIAHNPDDEETYFKVGTAKGFNQLHLNATLLVLCCSYINLPLLSLLYVVSYNSLIISNNGIILFEKQNCISFATLNSSDLVFSIGTYFILLTRL